MSQVLVLDYETRSKVDLKKVGAFEYARSSGTEILCVAWKLVGEVNAPRVWSPHIDSGGCGELLRHLLDPTVELSAHNALFEQVITRYVLARLFPSKPGLDRIPHERWSCTAALAASFALPRSLEGACQALGLDVQKDMEGRRLILKYCKPRKPTKHNRQVWHKDVADLERLMLYCQNDVSAEEALFNALPPLSSEEREVWLLDQVINFRGFQVDRETVGKVLAMIETETTNLDKQTRDLTKGRVESVNQRQAVLDFIAEDSFGYTLPDLRAKTVADELNKIHGQLQPKSRMLLEIRQAVSKTSTAKYSALYGCSTSDGRVRDTLVYWAASTGRWGGRTCQPQNFPRGTIADTDSAAEDLATGDLEWVRLMHGDPMEAFSSCLRAMIVAPERRKLIGADFASIEVRVLFWLAGHEKGLDAFREDRDLYREMATKIYGVPLDKVEKYQREVGKRAILGCGYNMGAHKFGITCETFGTPVTEKVAELAVSTYRVVHAPVPQLWRDVEQTAIRAVRDKSEKSHAAGRCMWYMEGDFLFCELPSERRLAYYKPEVRYEPTPWGDPRPKLYFWSVNPATKQWEQSGTYGGHLVENMVQAVARDLLVNGVQRLEAAGFETILTVHDEVLSEMEDTFGEPRITDVEWYETLMCTLPAWAHGCPVKAEGWEGKRYKK